MTIHDIAYYMLSTCICVRLVVLHFYLILFCTLVMFYSLYCFDPMNNNNCQRKFDVPLYVIDALNTETRVCI